MSGPLVTVLMPARNASAHIETAIRSILGQTWRDFELLVIDDASEDDTAERVNRFRDPRIRLLKNAQRLKLSGSLNIGIREARGTWIARMDADDIAHPARLARQLRFLNRHPDVSICGTAVDTFGGETVGQRLKYPEHPDCVRAFSLFHCPFAHPTVVFRKKDFVELNLFYDVSFYPTEDYELWARALVHLRGANLPAALLKYRRHASSMTGAEWTDMDRQASRVQARLLAALGLPSDTHSAERHRAWSMGRIEPSVECLREAESWLIAIKKANESCRLYTAEALDCVLAERWFVLAMACASAGMEIWRCYVESPLTGSGWSKIHRASILGASIVKHARIAHQHV
ncbi:MAG: glycosyltransferase [Kiritimatiellae bacterium]|nr:glycosyltransferase [Kiritimatiellia bacterium]MDW8458673.1 glycosyltransferase [Verrucomicrobiota bacterium]